MIERGATKTSVTCFVFQRCFEIACAYVDDYGRYMQREDYLIRLIRQFAEFLARIAGLREKGDFKGALAETQRAWDDLVGQPRELLEVVDSKTYADLLRDPDRIRIAAKLLVEEGHSRAGAGDPVHATLCYVRALELLLEARSRGEAEPDDERLFDVLARVAPSNQLDERYRDGSLRQR
jgi:hypothetical protein